jgi:hypothetical protein
MIVVPMQRLTLPLDELRPTDAPTVERLLQSRPGVRRVYVSVEMEMAYVEFDPDQADLDQLIACLLAAGHHVGAPTFL